MEEISDGLWRATFPLPWELDHVHAYLLEAEEGWVVVDTALGSSEARELWSALVAGLNGPVARIVVTHFHPDHIGGAGYLAELTGAPVYQGEIDHMTAKRVWGDAAWAARLSVWYQTHGIEERLAEKVIDEAVELRDKVMWPEHPLIVEPGDRLNAAGEDWEFVPMAGHADGQLVLFGTSTGRMLAGDHVLTPITPNIGLHPESDGDPLGDYLESLDATIALGPSVAFGGHRDPIPDTARRAAELKEHHAERLAATVAAVGEGTLTAYEVSLRLFGTELSTHGRRFAVAETLAHLARLELDDQVACIEDETQVRWCDPAAIE